MTRRLFLSGVNFIAYLFVGIILIAYGSFLFSEYSTYGLIYFGIALVVLLFMSFIVGFVLSRCFPDRRSSQFAFLFNVIEGVCIMILFMAGVELSLQSIEGLRFLDEWELVFVSKSLVTSNDIFQFSEIADGFVKQAGLYPTIFTFKTVVPIVQQLIPGIEATEVILKSMLTIHILIAFLTYRCARLLSGRVASIAVFALMMLLPSQMYSPSVLNIYAIGSMWVMAQIWIFLWSRRMARKEDPMWIRFLMDVLAAVFAGLSAFCNPVFFLLLPAEIIYICLFQKNRSGLNPEKYSIRFGHSIILFIGSIGTCAGMMLMQASDMKASFLDVLFGSFETWFLKGDFIGNFLSVWSNENYVDEVLSIGNSYINIVCYGCLLGTAFICLIFCWFLKERDLFVLEFILLGIGVITGLNGSDTIMHLAAIPILAIFAGALFEKVYSALRYQAFRKMNELEHSASEAKTEEQEEDKADEHTEDMTEGEVTAVSETAEKNETENDESEIIEPDRTASDNASEDEVVILRVDDVIAQNRMNPTQEPGIFDRPNMPVYDLEIKEYPQEPSDEPEIEEETVNGPAAEQPVIADEPVIMEEEITERDETEDDYDYETSSDDDYDYFK